MMRALYTVLLLAAQPWLWWRLWWRGRREPGYRQHLAQRWGRDLPPRQGDMLWLHAVSVGETRAAAPLVAALRARYPQYSILLTGMTPTGRQTAAELYGDTVCYVYLPYDLPGAVQRFLRHFQPVAGLLLETEVWPNLVAVCQAHGTPLALVNARLSERSLAGYQRFSGLTGPAFAGLTLVCAQTQGDATRLRAAGARAVQVCGNVKFDIAPPSPQLALAGLFRQRVGNRPLLLLASSREGEEALWLDAMHHHAQPWPDDMLLLLVPRHPRRVDEVEALIQARGLSCQRRSDGLAVAASTRVWLGDSLGEMFAYYAVAQLAVIGGSLLPFGGQNLIEACAVGCPVLLGPHTHNFAQASELAVAAGAARQERDVQAVCQAAWDWLRDAEARRQAGLAGVEFAKAHQGATERTVEALSVAWSSAWPS